MRYLVKALKWNGWYTHVTITSCKARLELQTLYYSFRRHIQYNIYDKFFLNN